MGKLAMATLSIMDNKYHICLITNCSVHIVFGFTDGTCYAVITCSMYIYIQIQWLKLQFNIFSCYLFSAQLAQTSFAKSGSMRPWSWSYHPSTSHRTFILIHIFQWIQWLKLWICQCITLTIRNGNAGSTVENLNTGNKHELIICMYHVSH